ncbi:ABC transporter permease subunit [Salinibaculum rarum]|uniref:ABC transporter permease subunit n=1 Tax=Salinibaculum rarum TaxID=3058903 RepID=UPI00265E7FDB|nr:ABC transporter permease subunit [Salinibaculum sp. KK48]
MFEFARYYGRRRVKGSLALAAGLAVLTSLYVYMFPSISEGVDLDAYIEAMPPAFRAAFGVQSLGSIEGFLAAELYSFGIVLLMGLYLTYSAASVIADDVEDERMDMLLALPVTRSKLLLEKFVALLVPIVVVSVVLPVVVYLGVVAIGESISVPDLLMAHVLSVPYLLTTAAVGLFASVWFDRTSLAQRASMGVVFGLFLIDSVVTNTDFADLGVLSPMRYYDPAAILVQSEYDLAGGVILLVAALGLVGASRAYLQRKDIS